MRFCSVLEKELRELPDQSIRPKTVYEVCLILGVVPMQLDA